MVPAKRRRRLLLVFLGLFSLFSLLVVQFFKIQIFEGDKWSAIAKRQHFFTIKEPFKRGTFWSNGEVRKFHPKKPLRFAFDLQKYHLYIDPLSIPEHLREEIITFLLGTVPMTEKEKESLSSHFQRQSRSRKIVMWLGEKEKEAILDWWRPFARREKMARNALYFVSEYKRSYPLGKSLGPVLHTIREVRDETTKRAYPTGGLELSLDKYLRGQQGERQLKRSPRHAFETGEISREPVDGADVFLTIDAYLQSIVEEELKKGVERCQAKGATAVLMDPFSGEILALGQYPYFNPEEYRKFFNDPEKMAHTRVHAVLDTYEPGSVLKPFTGLVALMANKELERRGEPPLFDPKEKIATADGRFPGRRKPISDVSFHKYLDMDMAIQKSSNIYMGRLMERVVERLGEEWYREVLETRLGFGIKTEVELPAESAGLLPRIGKKHPNGTLEWSKPTPFSLAMGYNLQLSSLQVARLYAMLANGGYWVHPTLIKKIVGKKVYYDESYRPQPIQVLDEMFVERVLEAMQYTMKAGGSGTRALVKGYTQAGKSGTSHKSIAGGYSEKLYSASFAGIVPLLNPAFVLVVAIDEPEKKYIPGVGRNYMGSVAAAPVFQGIASRAIAYFGTPPDDPDGTIWNEENRELQNLYKEWNR